MNILADYQNRKFQIWEYSVGHSQLLLRSTKTQENDIRIDILCKGVGYIKLPTTFKGLLIEEADVPLHEEIIRNIGYTPDNTHIILRLSGSKYVGYIDCLSVFVEEDKGEYNDPSPFANSLKIVS